MIIPIKQSIAALIVKEMAAREALLQRIKNKESVFINYPADEDQIPRRAEFINTTLRGVVDDQIKKQEEVLFLPTTYSEEVLDGKYTLYMYGVTVCGTKTTVIVSGIRPYVDIRKGGGKDYDNMEQLNTSIGSIAQNSRNSNLKFTGREEVGLKPLHGFNEEPIPHMRYYFKTLADRANFIFTLRKQIFGDGKTFKFYGDDYKARVKNYYFNKVARENDFSTSGWNLLQNYAYHNDRVHARTDRVFFVDISEIRAYADEPVTESLRPYINKDNNIVCSWDIETHSNSPGIPEAGSDYEIFMLCCSFFFTHDREPFLNVCICTQDIAPRESALTIICKGGQDDLVQCFGDVMKLMQPDISCAFNGSNFDWDLVIDRASKRDLHAFLNNFCAIPYTTAQMGNTHVRGSKMKIDAENDHMLKHMFVFPGLLDIDVMPIFMKLYPRAEVKKAASLNYFLERNNLSSKEDMPYTRMFKIYLRSVAFARDEKYTTCHCGTECDLCKEVVKEIDCVPKTTELSETIYTRELHADIAGKCCACGKRPRNLLDMADVAKYCIVDCIRPQQLLVKRAIILEKRELANLSCTALFNAIFNADGSRVNNLVGKYAYLYKVSVPARADGDRVKDHYPGALVINSQRGLYRDYPITGLDFASLYPSIMRAFNISPDMVIKNDSHWDTERAKTLKEKGYTLIPIESFSVESGDNPKGSKNNVHGIVGHDGIAGWTVFHNGIIDAGKDTNIIERHEKVGPGKFKPIYGREALPGERMGIFAYIVNILFEARLPIKAQFVELSELKEEMVLAGKKTVTYKGDVYNEDELNFLIAKVESKQKALKVLANTFYGESGNFRSPIYELLVAAGITCMGQKYLRKVKDFVEARGYVTKYGDTDSLYLMCPAAIYKEIEVDYKTRMGELCAKYATVPLVDRPTNDAEQKYKDERVAVRVENWTRRVKLTMSDVSALNVAVTEFLVEETNGRFMKMAYEEVGFPTELLGKKKYCMTPHIKNVNFYAEPFIRGIDIIKQGQADITKEMGMRFIRRSLSPENECDSLLDLALIELRAIKNLGNNPEKFVLSARWKQDKKNIPVSTFVDRMKVITKKTAEEEKYLTEPPEPGDKFKYVMIKHDSCNELFTVDGCRREVKKGARMEYLRVYENSLSSDNPMEIDLNYYISNALIGIFARFICSDDRFAMPGSTEETDYKIEDKYRIDHAKKFLENECDKILGISKEKESEIGTKFKHVFKEFTKAVEAELYKSDFSDNVKLALSDLFRMKNSMAGKEKEYKQAPFDTIINQYEFDAWAANEKNAVEREIKSYCDDAVKIFRKSKYDKSAFKDGILAGDDCLLAKRITKYSEEKTRLSNIAEAHYNNIVHVSREHFLLVSEIVNNNRMKMLSDGEIVINMCDVRKIFKFADWELEELEKLGEALRKYKAAVKNQRLAIGNRDGLSKMGEMLEP